MFINEFVSDTDIQKYGLDNIWDRYHPIKKVRTLPGFRHDWTIDRDKDIYLMLLSYGMDELADQATFFMGWKGSEIVVTLRRSGGESIAKDVGNVRWELLRTNIPPGIPKQEVIETLKEALVVYGTEGATRTIKNLTVQCAF